jgi:hypothetical protein
MSRRALAWLIAGAAAATACYFLVARPPGNASYLVFYLGTPAVGVAFLAAGLAAWLRWPSSRLGLLFSLVGYFTLLPALDYLDNSAGFTIGNAAVSLAGAALAHLGLAWPTGRLRARRARHRDRRPGTGRAARSAPGHAGPGAWRFDAAAGVPGPGRLHRHRRPCGGPGAA